MVESVAVGMLAASATEPITHVTSGGHLQNVLCRLVL